MSKIKLRITKKSDRDAIFEILKDKDFTMEDSEWVITHFPNKHERYEFVMEVKTYGKDVAMNNLKSEEFSSLPYDFKTRGMSIFDMYKTKEYARVELEVAAPKGAIIVGKYICRNCGCNRIEQTERQFRAADEPATQLFKCTSCFFTWRIG